MNHTKNCKCLICSGGLANALQTEDESIERFGWYAHMITDPSTACGADIHTHHLEESFGHLNLQIVLPMPAQTAMSILHTIIDNFIRKGVALEPGKEYKEIITNGYSVTFTKAIESGRGVLRVIFPDKYGYCQPNEPMDEQYKLQYA